MEYVSGREKEIHCNEGKVFRSMCGVMHIN